MLSSAITFYLAVVAPGRKLLLLLSLLCAGSVLVHTFLAADGWSRRARVRRDLQSVDDEIQRATARVADYRAQIEALHTNTAVQERVVRAELGYVRPDDAIIELGELPKTPEDGAHPSVR